MKPATSLCRSRTSTVAQRRTSNAPATANNGIPQLQGDSRTTIHLVATSSDLRGFQRLYWLSVYYSGWLRRVCDDQRSESVLYWRCAGYPSLRKVPRAQTWLNRSKLAAIFQFTYPGCSEETYS